MTLKPLICPSCGGKIHKNLSSGVWQCTYCDTLIYNKEKNINITNKFDEVSVLELAKKTFNLENYESCCSYCDELLENNIQDYAVWYLKATSLAMQNKDNRISNAVDCYKKAYEYAGDNLEFVKDNIHNDIYDIALLAVNEAISDLENRDYVAIIKKRVNNVLNSITDIARLVDADMQLLVLQVADLITHNSTSKLNNLLLSYRKNKFPTTDQWIRFTNISDNCLNALNYACQLIDIYYIGQQNNVHRYKEIISLLVETCNSKSYRDNKIDRFLNYNEKQQRKLKIDNLVKKIHIFEPIYQPPKF